MKRLFEKNDFIELINTNKVKNPIKKGKGLYRDGYREYGASFWGWEPASTIKLFFEKFYKVENPYTVLDLGAGTGKNSIECIRQNAKHVTSVEIDPIACKSILDAKIILEDNRFIQEDSLSILNMNAFSFLEGCTAKFDIVISYGFLHVIKDLDILIKTINDISLTVESDGYLIIQFLTDRYKAPKSQPELEGIIINRDIFLDAIAHWECIYFNEDDIVHSHTNSEQEHKHGSFRIILKNTIKFEEEIL